MRDAIETTVWLRDIQKQFMLNMSFIGSDKHYCQTTKMDGKITVALETDLFVNYLNSG